MIGTQVGRMEVEVFPTDPSIHEASRGYKTRGSEWGCSAAASQIQALGATCSLGGPANLRK